MKNNMAITMDGEELSPTVEFTDEMVEKLFNAYPDLEAYLESKFDDEDTDNIGLVEDEDEEEEEDPVEDEEDEEEDPVEDGDE